MKNTIITISREFGTGGRTIGRNVAKELGIPCYDSEIIETLIKESGFEEEFVSKQEESRAAGLWMFAPLGAQYSHTPFYNTETPQEELWKLQNKIIREIADRGPCVIVGRCADYILRDRDDVLKVFIYAPDHFRVKYVTDKYHSNEYNMRQKDKHRKAYYKFCTDHEFGQAKNYHMSLDSSKLGIEGCAEVIVSQYK